jgi:predicted house-cleaning noncanonical NTP pyrophosphatase (MazG superfamily)
MPRKLYNKLIRDRIPEILRSQEIPFAVETMSLTEHQQALRQKLMEEAQEAAEASIANLPMEIADLLEVIDAALDAYGLSRAQVLACQQERRVARGAFTQRLRLLWTEIE